MKGVIGAISLVSVSSAHFSVANAAAPSGVDGPSQNRRRDRRTYQFDTSSMNAAIRRPAAAESKASSAAVTSRTTRFSSLSSQRSSAARSAGGGAPAPAGAPRPAGALGPAGAPAPTPRSSGGRAGAANLSAALAYRTRNEAVFQ